MNVLKCNRFRVYIEEWGLLDVELKGPRFTWKGPKWRGYEWLYKKLDRCLCSVQWLDFLLMPCHVGSRICSDHHPILIDTKPDRRFSRCRPFRFEVAWLTHEKFKEFLGSNWVNTVEAPRALRKLQGDLVQWNRTVFGKIEHRKKDLNKEIYEVQRRMEVEGNGELAEVERRLQDKLLETLRQEEILWFQKSRGKVD